MQSLRQVPVLGSLQLVFRGIREAAVVLIDAGGQLTGWNPGAERLLGYPANEAIGRGYEWLFTPEDRSAGLPMTQLRAAAHDGQAVGEHWHIKRDGERFLARSEVVALGPNPDAGFGYVDTIRALTAHQPAPAAQDTATRIRHAVDGDHGYAFILLDDAGRITDWTMGAERLFGHVAADVVGRPVALLATPQDRHRGGPDSALREARERGRAERRGWRVRNNGSLFWTDEVVTAHRNQAGVVVGFTVVTRDATAQRRADLDRDHLRRQAQEQNRMKDEFLGTMSHELRTPLNAILGWTQLARVQDYDPAVMRRALEVIDRNARAQSRLIEDLVDVSRILAGTSHLQLDPLPMAEPLAAATEALRPLAETGGVNLTVDHHLEDDTVLGDPHRLQQVLTNLIANAIKFTPSGGRVAVATTRVDGWLELTVADSGVGIAKDFLPFVFERFRQADSGSTREHNGLGLGLSIVKDLVDLHGGTVTIDSAGSGHGTTVCLRLPPPDRVEAGQLQPATPPSAKQTSLRLLGRHVLLVDDDPDSLGLLELALTMEGAVVATAASTHDAVAVAETASPDIVMTDLVMPVEDGFTLLAALRGSRLEVLQRIPVVAVTANARAADRSQCLAAGFDAYCAKPFEFEEVIDLLKQLLNAKDRVPVEPTVAARPQGAMISAKDRDEVLSMVRQESEAAGPTPRGLWTRPDAVIPTHRICETLESCGLIRRAYETPSGLVAWRPADDGR